MFPRLTPACAIVLAALSSVFAHADTPAPQAGEIAVSGTVQAILPHRAGFVLLVGTITRPGGAVTTLNPPRPKTVIMPTGRTVSVRPGDVRDPKPGDVVSAIGHDFGVGQSLPARRVFRSQTDVTPLLSPVPPPPADGALPSPWASADVGKVGVPGAATYAGGTFTVSGSGEDMFGQADSFRFVSQPLHGDGQITARVVSYERRDQWTKVGVMLRESLAPGSKFADILVTPDADKGAEFQWRAGTNGDTQTTDQVPSPAPFWVRLTRAGDTVTGFVSKDGRAWQERGHAALPMAVDARGHPSDVLIGLCVCSHKNDTVTEAKIDSVTVTKPEDRSQFSIGQSF